MVLVKNFSSPHSMFLSKIAQDKVFENLADRNLGILD